MEDPAHPVTSDALRIVTPGVAISAFGLRCATGNQIYALLGAVATGMALGKPDPALEAADGNGGVSAVISCPALTDDPGPEPAHRLPALWMPALQQTAETVLPGLSPSSRVGVRLYAPPTDTTRGERLDLAAWTALMTEAADWPADTDLRAEPRHRHLLHELADACEDLEAGRTDCILLGTADSLLDPITVEELAGERRILCQGRTDGIVPGEAGVFLALQRPQEAGDRNLACIESLAIVPEPAYGRPDETRLNGLARAIAHAAQAKRRDSEAIDCLCLGLAGSRERQLEWSQVEGQLWPVRLSEDRQQAMQRGEIMAPQPDPSGTREILDPAITLGCTGQAEPLLSLLGACARFDFDWPPLTAAMVADIPDEPSRAALWLTRSD